MMKTLIAILILTVCYVINGGWNNSYEIAPSADEMNTAYMFTEELL